ncbi:MAG: SDR family NAD(P)-dependent oxidoreductase [Actinomycetota bacterium]
MPHTARNAAVVVTGASSGIGRAAALRFAADGAGLVLVARRGAVVDELARQCRRGGAKAVAVAGDVTDPATTERAAATALEQHGRLDVWVNNAGVLMFSRFGEEPVEDIRRLLDVNVMGYVLGARAALGVFREQGRGTLINVGSVLSEVPAPYLSAYVMSKHAGHALTACLRTELLDAPGIRVCEVLPAAVDTPLFQHAANYTGRAVKALTPVADPDRVAAAIVSCAKRPRDRVLPGAIPRLTVGQYGLSRRLTERASGRLVHLSHFSEAPAEPTSGNLHQPIEQGQGARGGWAGGPSEVARRVAIGPEANGPGLEARRIRPRAVPPVPVTAPSPSRARVDGPGVHAREWGDPTRPTVVLLHGLVVSSAMVVPTAERLAGSFHVLAPDMPGSGQTEVQEKAPTVFDIADALEQWWEPAVGHPAIVAGNSFGAQVAVELALRRPDLVEALVLAGPIVDPSASALAKQLYRWMKEQKTQSGELRRLLRREWREVGPVRGLRTFLHARSDRIEDKLPFVSAPTMVVRGTKDPIVSQAWAEEVARLLPRGELWVLDGVPHAMAHDAPDAFATVISDFAASTDGARHEEASTEQRKAL